MSSEYPAQATVHKLIGDGKWPATKGEILHINSLEQWQIKLIEMYNQEEIIKQLRMLNSTLTGQIFESVEGETDDEYGVDDLAEDVQDFFTNLITGKKK